MTEDEIKRIVWTCIWQARGSAPTDRDYNYYVPMWPGLVARGIEINHPHYAEDRALGWEAEGADAPAFGPFANPPSAPHAVPPFPGDPVPEPVPVPMPSPDGVTAMLGAILTKLNDVEVLLLQQAGKPAPIYTGHVGVHTWVGDGNVTLTPKP